MPTELTFQIQAFIGLVEAYVDKGKRYAKAEKVACHMARQGEEAHAINAEIPEYLDQFKKSRQAVLTAAMPLAEAIERAGVSSRNVLALCNAVGGPGGPASSRKLWAKLKAELQQIVIRGGKSTTPPDDSDSWVLISKLQPPRIESIKERRRYIEKHSTEIKSRPPLTKAGTPHPKRLEVHVGDWIRHWDKVDGQTFNGLDAADPAPLTNDKLTEDFMGGATKLYSKVFKGKRSRP